MEFNQNKRAKPDTRTQVVCSEIRELAYKKGPESPLPSVEQLCETFWAPSSTIYSALQELEAQNVLYRKDDSYCVSPKLHNKTISLILGSHFFHTAGASPFWDILWGLFVAEAERRATTDRNFSFHIDTPNGHYGEPLQEGLGKMIEAGQTHGIVGIGLADEAVAWINQRGIPLVTCASESQWSVGIDFHELSRVGVPYLAEKGCRRIGFWQTAYDYRADPPEEREVRAEIGIFREAVTSNGLAFYPDLLKDMWHYWDSKSKKHVGTHQEQGYRAVMETFGPNAVGTEEGKPDGLVITDDLMTDGAMAAFRELGIRPGEHVPIVSHGNVGSIVLFGYEEEVTILEYNPAQIVGTMFEMIEVLMAGGLPPEPCVLIRPRLRPIQHGVGPCY